ncbi:hypothetical protein QM012_008224 [Aureobasidium pullulans]|uniref:Rhodanese domain-containing protein n=1 Tax=Aureobasidium pullulans TaxID=5580 RepID=A0ABR0TJ54_AURPU
MSQYNIANLPRISHTSLASLIRTKHPSLTIIDVRDSDYIGGHILGCQNLPTNTHDYKMPELTRDVDFNVRNCFVLILSPDQQDFQRGLEPITAPLTSNFVDADIQQLAEVSRQRFEGMPSANLEDQINVSPFIIIDERTLEDGTLRVVQSDIGPFYGEDGEIVSEEDVRRLETVRCEVKQLAWLLELLNEEGMIQFKCNQEVPLGDNDVAEL